MNRQDNHTALSLTTSFLFIMAEDSNGFGWQIGNSTYHSNGDTGTYNFTAANSTDFSQLAAMLTDGHNDSMEFLSHEKSGPSYYGVSNEGNWFGTNPDFNGNAIDFIDLVVHDVHIYAFNGSFRESANYTWQVWGHPLPVYFIQPTDSNGTLLIYRSYTNIKVKLTAAGTTQLEWNGVNYSMTPSSGNTIWSKNVSVAVNGNYTYQVWATIGSNVYGTEVRLISFQINLWTPQFLNTGEGPSIVTSADGTMHVCYEDVNGTVEYATRTPTAWSIQYIGTGGGGTCSATFDSQGAPHLIFGTLKYAFYSGTGWTTSVISPNGLAEQASIAMDPITNEPVVAYHDADNNTLVFATYSAGTWSRQVVYANGITAMGLEPSLAVDALGHAHIAYTDSAGDLQYASWTGTAWTIQTVDHVSPFTGHDRISLALDSSGSPHISFPGGGPYYGTIGYGGLLYATWNGASWTVQQVAPGPVLETSLAINSQDFPRIAYSLVGTAPPSTDLLMDLRYASWNGTGWYVQVLSHAVDTSSLTLGLSPTGAPVVVAPPWCCSNGTDYDAMSVYTTGPTASFSVTPSLGNSSTTFTFDPRSSTDAIYSASSLKARWGYSTLGVWDTSWLSLSPVTHVYASSGVHTVYLEVWDPLGIVGITSRTLIVDNLPPVTTVTLTGTQGASGVYVTPVRVTLNATDDLTAVTTYDQVDGGAWSAYTGPFNVSTDGSHTVDYYSVDAAGNAETVQNVSFQISTSGPLTTATVFGTLGNAGWYVSSVQMSLAASGGAGGRMTLYYRVDNGSWQTYSALFTVGQGVHTVQYYAVDGSGNQGPLGQTVVKEDTSAPAIVAQLGGTAGDAGWYVSAVLVSLNAQDNLSGVATLSVSVDGGAWQNLTAGSFSQTVSSDGLTTITYYATDVAGNTGTPVTTTLKIDQTPPAASAQATGTAGTNGWLTSNATITLSATDATSGVASLTYSVDGGVLQTYATPFTLGNGVHTVAYVATDVAGNVAPVQTLAVKVDTLPPRLTMATSGTASTTSVSISWTGIDTISGIAGYAVSVDGGAFASVGNVSSTTLTLADGAHTITVRATDNAGNTVEAQTTITVDTNPFSISGPYHGLPTFALIIAAIAVVAFLVWYVRRRKKPAVQAPAPKPPEVMPPEAKPPQ